MKVFVLGLDGATWDLLKPLAEAGHLPNLSRLMANGASGVLGSVFPPLSPVAWTGIMTGKNSGKHGVFEFLELHLVGAGSLISRNFVITQSGWLAQVGRCQFFAAGAGDIGVGDPAVFFAFE